MTDERELYRSPYVGDAPPVVVTLPPEHRHVEVNLWRYCPEAKRMVCFASGTVTLPAEVLVR